MAINDLNILKVFTLQCSLLINILFELIQFSADDKCLTYAPQMHRYYFSVRNDYVTDDEDGAEFADFSAARDYAIIAARGLAADAVGRGVLVLSHRIEILNADSEIVGTVTFADAVDVRP